MVDSVADFETYVLFFSKYMESMVNASLPRFQKSVRHGYLRSSLCYPVVAGLSARMMKIKNVRQRSEQDMYVYVESRSKFIQEFKKVLPQKKRRRRESSLRKCV